MSNFGLKHQKFASLSTSGLYVVRENFLVNLRRLPLWVNRDLSATVFGGKQNYEYWQTVFETGKTPQGQTLIASGGINLIKMIQSQ